MKTKLKSMYGWTLILLLFLSLFTSYYRQEFPTALIVAIVTASILDLAIKKILKKSLGFPYSAIITGIIIGSVAQFHVDLIIVVVASIIAIGSKFVIKIKGKHIFNPAVLGLLISFILFSSGDEWWVAVGYNFLGYTIILTPILILVNYKAMKLGVSLPFILITAILYFATFILPLNLEGAINLFYTIPYYFVFIMVSEPKTSPHTLKQQIVFGVSVAVLSFVFMQYGILYYQLIALLIGNLGFSLYRFKVNSKTI